MRRDWPFVSLLLLALALFAAFAWSTRHPDWGPLVAAAEWPVVGPAVAAFRARYVGDGGPPAGAVSPVAGAAAPEGADREIVILGAPARGRVWLHPGTPLLEAPRPGAAPVLLMPALANPVVLGESGAWLQVAWRGQRGWVPRASVHRPEHAPQMAEPAPPLPRPAPPPDPQRLARALARLQTPRRTLAAGPYELHTDSGDRALLLLLDRAAAQIEPAYRRYYGLQPMGEARGAVVLFQRRDDFAAYAMGDDRAAADAYASGGVVASWREGRPPGEVRASLLHELVHLLNRRALGPALPLWLEEGTADALGESAFDGEGRLVPGSLGGSRLERTPRWELHGGLAARELWQRAAERRELLPLTELVRVEDAPPGASSRQLLYVQAGFLVRFLLAGEHGDGFRAFLGGIAAGDPATAEALEEHLGVPLADLEGGLAAWVRRLGVGSGGAAAL